ncbi:hypothetical protein OG21DRAFT_1484962 [Imleria badia]|nr:hypothetical protein OG21DRAFT_1484962 [Imleria badia]
MLHSVAGPVIIIPSAETLSQAQILTDSSKPFELAGLFGTADTGAFLDEVTISSKMAEIALSGSWTRGQDWDCDWAKIDWCGDAQFTCWM